MESKYDICNFNINKKKFFFRQNLICTDFLRLSYLYNYIGAIKCCLSLFKSRVRSRTQLLEYTCIKSINIRVFNTRVFFTDTRVFNTRYPCT
jgi:hypothetical protein